MLPGVMVHTFYPSTQSQRWVNLCKFEVSLVYVILVHPGLHSENLSPKEKQKSKHASLGGGLAFLKKMTFTYVTNDWSFPGTLLSQQ